jgi:hypothetical protein
MDINGLLFMVSINVLCWADQGDGLVEVAPLCKNVGMG